MQNIRQLKQYLLFKRARWFDRAGMGIAMEMTGTEVAKEAADSEIYSF